MTEKYHEKPMEKYTPQQRDFIEKGTIVECVYSAQGEICSVDCPRWDKCWSPEDKSENN